MRDRKTLIYLNIKDLTQEEIEALGDMELNSCDNCGEIDSSYKLRWIDSDEEFWGDPHCIVLVSSGMCAIDEDCYQKRKEKLANCGSCEKYFVATDGIKGSTKGVQDCPHCGSMNWIYGCIDQADVQCFNCKGNTDCELEAFQDCQYNPANKDNPDKEKEYNVSYRNEFSIDVKAKNKDEAIQKALKINKWNLIGDLHFEYLDTFCNETGE